MTPTKKLIHLGAALFIACPLHSAWSVCAQTKPELRPQPAPKQKDDAKQYSKAVSAGGADFEVGADRVWHRPIEIYDQTAASISLRITNRSDKDLTFSLVDNLKLSLKAADGKD